MESSPVTACWKVVLPCVTAVELLTRAINRYVDEDDNYRPENASVDEATDSIDREFVTSAKKIREF